MATLARPTNGDLVAGVSVALVAVPQAMAYAELAGLPPQYGLYATALPSLLAAVFVSSRHLQTGPVALVSLLTFGALSPLEPGGGAEFVALAALLALMVGAVQLLMGVTGLGRVAYLLTPPVLVGFTTAAAVTILASQLPKVFDVDPDDGNLILEALRAVVEVDAWRWSAIAFAAVAMVVIYGGRQLHPLFPGVLVAVIASVVVSEIVSYDGSVVGALPGGFVDVDLSLPWSRTDELIVPAVAIALIGFAESAAISRTYARIDGDEWSANREVMSQGMANVGAAVSGAFPVSGSFSRSSLNRRAGATSAWAGAITGIVVLACLPATPLLERLPEAVLGAIVVWAVVKLIDVTGFRRLAAASQWHLLVGVITLVATIATAPRVERGVAAGVVASLLVQWLAGTRFSDEPAHE